MRAPVIFPALALAAAFVCAAPGAAYADGVEAPQASSASPPASSSAAALTPASMAPSASGEIVAPAESEDQDSAEADTATGSYDATLVVIRTGPARTSPFAFAAAGAQSGRR